MIYHTARWFRRPGTTLGHIGWKMPEALGGLPSVYILYYSRRVGLKLAAKLTARCLYAVI